MDAAGANPPQTAPPAWSADDPPGGEEKNANRQLAILAQSIILLFDLERLIDLTQDRDL